MNACDVVAWIYCGSVYCDDCQPTGDKEGGPSPVFGDSIGDIHGATCDACSSCMVDGEWMVHEDAVGPSVRWSRCDSCNSQKPWPLESSDYRQVRRLALRGGAPCGDCGKRAVHFH